MNQWFILSTQQCSSGASFTCHLCTSRDPFCHLVAEQQLCFLFICPLVFFSGIFMSTCNVDVRWFPFDIQRCELKFGSWTYDGWLLDLQMSDADISSFMPNGEWDLIGEYGETSFFFFLSSSKTPSRRTDRVNFSPSLFFQGFPAPETRSSMIAVRSLTQLWRLLWRYVGGRSTMPWTYSSPACCCRRWPCSSLCYQLTQGRRSHWVSG